MEKTGIKKNMSLKCQDVMTVKVDECAYPGWLLKELVAASDSISVSHEALFHFLISTVNYTLLHSDVLIENMDWKEPVLVWNLIIGASGSRKTLVYKTCMDMLDEAIEMLEKKDKISVSQYQFNEGSVEKIGMMMKANDGKICMLQEEAARYISLNSGSSSGKGPKDASFEMLLLLTYGGGKLSHHTMGGTNYELKRSGLLAGGFTQPEVGTNFLADQAKSATGYPQRYNFHYIQSKHLDLCKLSAINPKFKEGIVKDVLYPLLKDSCLRKCGVKKYILKENSIAYILFEDFHDNLCAIKKRLSTGYIYGYDTVCSYIGKLDGKVLRESAVLTELIARLSYSLGIYDQFEDDECTQISSRFDQTEETLTVEKDSGTDCTINEDETYEESVLSQNESENSTDLDHTSFKHEMYKEMVVISQEAMKLAIASSLRSYQQILILFSLNVDNLPMPEKSDAGKIITSGGYEIFRSRIVKKKIGKLSAPEVQSVFMEMANYNWGEIIVRENKRGRESVIFKIRKDLMQDESCVRKLTQHGVSSSDMESALDAGFIESDDEDKYSRRESLKVQSKKRSSHTQMVNLNKRPCSVLNVSEQNVSISIDSEESSTSFDLSQLSKTLSTPRSSSSLRDITNTAVTSVNKTDLVLRVQKLKKKLEVEKKVLMEERRVANELRNKEEMDSLLKLQESLLESCESDSQETLCQEDVGIKII